MFFARAERVKCFCTSRASEKLERGNTDRAKGETRHARKDVEYSTFCAQGKLSSLRPRSSSTQTFLLPRKTLVSKAESKIAFLHTKFIAQAKITTINQTKLLMLPKYYVSDNKCTSGSLRERREKFLARNIRPSDN